MPIQVVRRIGRRLPALQAAEAVQVGDLVYITTAGKWAIAKANAAGKAEVRGVVTMGAGPGEFPEVCESAHLTGFSGLVPGFSLFLGTLGVSGSPPIQQPPQGQGTVVVKVGYAVSETDAVIACTGYYQVVGAS